MVYERKIKKKDVAEVRDGFFCMCEGGERREKANTWGCHGGGCGGCLGLILDTGL